MLDKFRKKIRSFIASVYKNLYYYLKTLNLQKLTEDAPIAMVNLGERLQDQSNGRFAFILCKYLEKAGYNIVFKTDRKYYNSLSRYKKILLKQNYRFINETYAPLNSLLFIKNKNEKLVKLYNSYNLDHLESDLIYSFPMHPFQVSNFNDETLNSYRSTRRTIKIFFSGSIIEGKYSRSALEKEYNVISRFPSFNYILETYGNSDLLEIITEKKQLYTILTQESFSKKIVLSKEKSELEDWLKFLSISEFFISLPGVEHPWCHNAIESMAVGTIPILQYPHLFYPSLQHRKNCLSYSNLYELGQAIELALNMKNQELEELKRNVIDYFEEHLSPKIYIHKFKDIHTSDSQDFNITIPFLKP